MWWTRTTAKGQASLLACQPVTVAAAPFVKRRLGMGHAACPSTARRCRAASAPLGATPPAILRHARVTSAPSAASMRPAAAKIMAM
eukprot:1128-Chlamydomonas_euryale.AAC.1